MWLAAAADRPPWASRRLVGPASHAADGCARGGETERDAAVLSACAKRASILVRATSIRQLPATSLLAIGWQSLCWRSYVHLLPTASQPAAAVIGTSKRNGGSIALSRRDKLSETRQSRPSSIALPSEDGVAHKSAWLRQLRFIRNQTPCRQCVTRAATCSLLTTPKPTNGCLGADAVSRH